MGFAIPSPAFSQCTTSHDKETPWPRPAPTSSRCSRRRTSSSSTSVSPIRAARSSTSRCRRSTSAIDKFEAGHAFDGSSIAGWKGIQASDMLLMPDPNTAVVDPVHGRDDGQHHLRRRGAVRRQGLRARPALAREARRGLPQVDRPRRRRVLRARARVLHLRRRRVERRHGGQLLQDLLRGSGLVHGRQVRGRQPGPPADGEGRLLPRAAGRLAAGHPLRDVPRARADGRRGRGAPPRGGDRGPVRDRHQVRAARAARRLAADPEVRRAQHRGSLRQDRHVHAEAHRRRQRLRHARPPVGLEGRQEPVRRRRLRGPVGVRAVLHRRHHQARARAQRDHQPGHELLQAAGAGLRGAGEARLLRAQPLGVDPHPLRQQPEGAPHRGPLPGPDRELRTSRSRRC